MKKIPFLNRGLLLLILFMSLIALARYQGCINFPTWLPQKEINYNEDQIDYSQNPPQ